MAMTDGSTRVRAIVHAAAAAGSVDRSSYSVGSDPIDEVGEGYRDETAADKQS